MSKKLVLIKAWGYVDDDGARFLLLDGNVTVPIVLIGEDEIEAIPKAIEEKKWTIWMSFQMRLLNGRLNRYTQPDWEKRADGIARSLYLRSRFRGRQRDQSLTKTGREHNTTNWHDASKRLVQMAKNKVKSSRRTPWMRWAFTAANNQNKRRGGAYADA